MRKLILWLLLTKEDKANLRDIFAYLMQLETEYMLSKNNRWLCGDIALKRYAIFKLNPKVFGNVSHEFILNAMRGHLDHKRYSEESRKAMEEIAIEKE